jgi:sulfatase maturation enzyme AslB (radical SAM superfamily)
MQKHTWFKASSIGDALSCGMAEKIRQNACGNCYGFCPEECSQWEDWDGTVPDVRLDRFDMAVGTQCNARCVFCFSADFKTKLPPSIIDEWRTSVLPAVTHLSFGGGEPLVVALKLIEEAVDERPDIKISLVTNGILLDRVIPLKDNIHGINVSLNAGSRDTYRRVLRVDAFDRVVENVKILRAAGYNRPISSTYVICRENVDDIANYLSVCKECGIDWAGFNVDRTNPFLRVPSGLAQTIKTYAAEIEFPVNIGNIDPKLTAVGAAKRLLLYFLRYGPRRKASPVRDPSGDSENTCTNSPYGEGFHTDSNQDGQSRTPG